jgi:hypothetical protein
MRVFPRRDYASVVIAKQLRFAQSRELGPAVIAEISEDCERE